MNLGRRDGVEVSKKRAFTLIELLVVIAIIAILTAMIMPTFIAAKQHAETMRCLGNLKQLAAAFAMYCGDNGGKMPFVGYGIDPNWCGSTRDTPRQCFLENGQIWGYTKNRAIYLCALDRGRPAHLQTGYDKNYPLSYTMNDKLSGQMPDVLQMVMPSKMMLLIQENRADINDGIFSTHRNQIQDYPSNVHYDGTMVAYIDGHARWARTEQLEEEMFRYWVPVGMPD